MMFMGRGESFVVASFGLFALICLFLIWIGRLIIYSRDTNSIEEPLIQVGMGL